MYLRAADGIRGLSVIVIVFLHSIIGFWPSTGLFLGGTGQFSVWTFFILSSLLLTNKFISNGVGAKSIFSYFVGRFLRIIPLFYLAVASYCLAGFYDVQKMKSILIFEDTYLHFWTIPIEFSFYLYIPIIAAICNFAFCRLKPVSFFCVMFLVVILHQCFFSYTDKKIIGSLIWYFPVFFFGIVTAYIINIKGVAVNAMAADIFSVLIITLCVLSTTAPMTYFFSENMRAWNTDKFVYIGVLLALFIYIVSFSSGLFNKALSGMVFTTLGKFSFSIYLWHMGIMMYLSKNHMGNYWYFALTIVLSVILGAVSFYLIESPLENARHKIMSYIFKENRLKANLNK